MRRHLSLTLLLVGSCSSSSSTSSGHAGFTGDPPSVTCEAPVGLYDVSTPTTVVGTGTAASCTEARLREAADAGGKITFDCGAEPVTVTVTSPIVFEKETIVDGGGKITLSGGGSSRIFYLDSAYNVTTPRLVVQRLTFIDGRGPGDLCADDQCDTAEGGAAIYRDGGSLTVIDCFFAYNVAPAPGPDAAGGAIYAFGGGDTVVVRSLFQENSASNGGAVGSLNGDLIVSNSEFLENAATGHGGSRGQSGGGMGGLGGAIYIDGADERTTLCGVTIARNTAGDSAGGIFRVSNLHNGTFTMDRTTVDSNTVTGEGGAGGLYLQGLDLNIVASTISRNRAYYNGGIWIHSSRVRAVNLTVAENQATGSNGGGIWISDDVAGGWYTEGELLNCTIADNHAGTPGVTNYESGAGAVFGGKTGVVLKNSLVSGNTGTWGPSCDEPLGNGGGNLQDTSAAPCAAGITVAAPLLGPLGDNGGPTETMLPSSSSPARNAGSGCPAVDQRGETRSTTSCTSGAVEVP